MKKAPRRGASFNGRPGRWLRGDLGLDLLGSLAVRDLDLSGLGGLRDLAHEVDMEQAVLQARALHLDMVGKLESALKGARGNAAIENLAVILGSLLLLA